MTELVVDFKVLKSVVSLRYVLDHYGVFGTLQQRKSEWVGFCPIHNPERTKTCHSLLVTAFSRNRSCSSSPIT